jgi:hypothetical protein
MPACLSGGTITRVLLHRVTNSPLCGRRCNRTTCLSDLRNLISPEGATQDRGGPVASRACDHRRGAGRWGASDSGFVSGERSEARTNPRASPPARRRTLPVQSPEEPPRGTSRPGKRPRRRRWAPNRKTGGERARSTSPPGIPYPIELRHGIRRVAAPRRRSVGRSRPAGRWGETGSGRNPAGRDEPTDRRHTV